jgi:protein-tyrosine phosphatase
VIDIHSHVLPGLDDGAQDEGTSLQMLRMASKGRIDTIFATPHYNMHFTAADLETSKRECRRLSSIAEENGINIDVVPGQEINIGVDVVNLYNGGIIGCLGNTRYMLLELRYKGIDNTDFEKIYELKLRGVIPVIPHPERYDYIINKPSIINKLIEEGCLMQINTGSILGIFGKECRKMADLLMKHRAAHLIGTDCHSIGRRCPNLDECMRVLKKKDKEYADMLINNSKKLLSNEPIINNASMIMERKGLFSLLAMK